MPPSCLWRPHLLCNTASRRFIAALNSPGERRSHLSAACAFCLKTASSTTFAQRRLHRAQQKMGGGWRQSGVTRYYAHFYARSRLRATPRGRQNHHITIGRLENWTMPVDGAPGILRCAAA